MRQILKSQWFPLILFGIVALLFAIWYWGWHRTDLTPIEETPVYKKTTFKLVTQYGDTVEPEDVLKGQYTIVGFFFTRCGGICPNMNRNLKKVYDAFPKVRIVSFSVDPYHDSVPVLRSYAKQWGVDDGRWLFLTGSRKDIYLTALDAFNLVVLEAKADTTQPNWWDRTFIHSEEVVLLNPQGQILRYYDTTDSSDMRLLIEHLEVLGLK
ncbi:MAG: SCO family protein [Chlorobi bacterium]|nr:SCO family protein [Chlorobiota bacterium]